MDHERAAKPQTRRAPIEVDGNEFKRLGYQVVDEIAAFLDSIRTRPVTPGESPEVVRNTLGQTSLPEHGMDPSRLLEEATSLLFDHSLLNGHPHFLGYITSSAAPIGALGDLLAAAVNPNVGAWVLSPMASEIEAQTIRWVAELIGYPERSSGLLVSGGNMANFVGFLAGSRAKTPWSIRDEGLRNHPPLTVYVSRETHTWIQKAADLFGLGTDSIRWIDVDEKRRMRLDALQRQVDSDRKAGMIPIMVVGSAGTVAFGAVDPLPQVAEFCAQQNLWFHVDGAYGAPAAALPEAGPDLQGLRLADSVALDPHKWLYSPLEAGCLLIKEAQHLIDAFSFHPEYYHFREDGADQMFNYFEFGMQNSRGFRALKVWLALRQVGRAGYIQMIRDDIAAAKALYDRAAAHPELEAVSTNLSITTFRFVPPQLPKASAEAEKYLSELNRAILDKLEVGGEIYVSNAVISERFLLRACVVNFRTAAADMETVVDVVVRVGRDLDAKLRPATLNSAG